MAKIDFSQVANYIFEQRYLYQGLSDQDKIDTFYMINHKLSKNYPTTALKFNIKGVDKASAIDVWFTKFNGSKKIPGYWYEKPPTKKEKESKIPKADREAFIEQENISEQDFEFLMKHFKEDVEYEIKKIKRFN